MVDKLEKQCILLVKEKDRYVKNALIMYVMWSLSYNNNERLFEITLVLRFTPRRCVNFIFNYNYINKFTESNLLKAEVPDSQVKIVRVVSLETITGQPPYVINCKLTAFHTKKTLEV